MWKKSKKTSKKIRTVYVPGWSNIRRTDYPINKYDTCGYTAACILLYYYHKNTGVLQGKMIEDIFFSNRGRLKKDGYTLQDKLLSYVSKSSSWAGSVAYALNCYFREYDIPAKARFGFFEPGAYFRLKKNTPVILFGNLQNVSAKEADSFPRINHAVLAYGLRYNNGALPHFIVHYGWKQKEFYELQKEIIGSYCYIATK